MFLMYVLIGVVVMCITFASYLKTEKRQTGHYPEEIEEVTLGVIASILVGIVWPLAVCLSPLLIIYLVVTRKE